MYILETNLINNYEDLFFQDTGLISEEESESFRQNAHEKNKPLFYNNKITLNHHQRFKRDDGKYQSISRIGYFKTISAAEKYYQDLISDGTNYRKVRREWQQKNKIINETNILDMKGNIVKTPHSCQGNTCLRFGTCPTTAGGGCDVITEKKSTPIYYHIPLSSIKKSGGLREN